MMFVGETWKTLELGARRAVECFKQGLMGPQRRNMDNSGTGGDVDHGVQLKSFQRRILLSVGLDSCNILVKNISTFSLPFS